VPRSQELPSGERASHPSLLPTLVIGLGNCQRGDDGVGVCVAKALATQVLPAGVEVVDGGTQGLGLVNLMEGRRRVIVVDAADMGRAPGQFLRCTLDEANLLSKDRPLSLHEAGLCEALLLAHALNLLPDEVVILGVQPASVEWDRDLSPEVRAALPALVAAVVAEVAPRPALERNRPPGYQVGRNY
jgi:hydrogenase maturation protease